MKKLVKTIAVTIAAVLVFGMTVSAAGSTDTSTSNAVADQLAKDAMNMSASGAEDLKLNPVGPHWLESAQAFANGQAGVGKVLTAFELTSSAKNVTVTVNYAGLEAGKSYVFLHYNGTSWDIIPATLNGQSLTGTFPSFSPVAIAEGTASAAVVAPKTGEVIALTAILAVIMMAGAAVCAKKARFQK